MDEYQESQPLSATAAVVRNPLSVIAMFVLLVEAIATVTLVQVSDLPIANPLVWFVVLFPTLIAVLFFCTIWWRHQFLYSPMEYRSDESFLTAMNRLKRVEARQEAAELDPRTTDVAQGIAVIDRLISFGDVRGAVRVGRTFLKSGQNKLAEDVFRHILENLPQGHRDRYNALANFAYALIGLGRYQESIEALNECISLIGRDSALPWHSIALAYAHYKLSNSTSDNHYQEFQDHLDRAKRHRLYNQNREFFVNLYPAIANDL